MCPLAGSTEETMRLLHTLIYTAMYSVLVLCQLIITKLSLVE